MFDDYRLYVNLYVKRPSLHLNPIEMLWHDLKHTVYA